MNFFTIGLQRWLQYLSSNTPMLPQDNVEADERRRTAPTRARSFWRTDEKRHAFLLGALGLVIFGLAGVTAAAVPAPPRQHAPWTAPKTSLPPVVVSAARELFEDGVADPRGCEFREVTYAWPPYSEKSTGWVIDAKAVPAYAVGWDGLIHEVKSVGLVLDLGREFRAKSMSFEFADTDATRLDDPYWSNGITGMEPLKAALLLRVGRADLAEEFWKQGFKSHPELAGKDPYVLMARSWLSASMGHVYADFFRAHDAEALAESHELAQQREHAEKVAAHRGIALAGTNATYFGGFELLPVITADLERRAQETPHVDVSITNLPRSDPVRTAALIRDLEDIAAEQMMNPGQTDVYDDPAVQLLVEQGDAAVEPLIDCWENDTRITRSRFTEGMSFGGPMIQVDEPAYLALSAILDHPFYFNDADDRRAFMGGAWSDPRDQHPRDLTMADRHELAVRMRAYWNSVKGMTLPERWFAMLQDDKAGPRAWQKAITGLTSSQEQQSVSFGIFGGWQGWGYPYQPGNPKGEALRGRANPSVSDLLLRRFREMMDDPAAPLDDDELGALLVGIQNWDPEGNVRAIADLQRTLRHRPERPSILTTLSARDAQNLLFERRLEAGDETALAEYADWITGLSPGDIGQGDNPVRYFHIMWHHDSDPAMDAVAKKLFGTNSKWNPIPNSLIETPLLGVLAFRTAVIEGLADKSDAGRVRYDTNSVSYNFTRTGESSTDSPGPMPAPKPGTTINLRVCDCYAARLAKVGGLPSFEFFWPLGKRNEAIARCRAFLLQYGADLASVQDDRYGEWLVSDVPLAKFSLPPLDHAATPADVREGRALFSLPGNARPWKLSTVPLGPVWAEETHEKGQWHRYYGLIEEGQPKIVPAEKMVFPPAISWPQVSGLVTPNLRASLADIRRLKQLPMVGMSFKAQPVNAAKCMLDVTLHNESGLDQLVPAEFLVPFGVTGVLPTGMTLSVSYSPKIPPYMSRISSLPFDPGVFAPVPLRPKVKVGSVKPSPPAIGPDQDFHVVHEPLSDFVDLSREGTYKVQVVLDPAGHPAVELGPVQFYIASYGG
jgi:hypothetical protein